MMLFVISLRIDEGKLCFWLGFGLVGEHGRIEGKSTRIRKKKKEGPWVRRESERRVPLRTYGRPRFHSARFSARYTKQQTKWSSWTSSQTLTIIFIILQQQHCWLVRFKKSSSPFWLVCWLIVRTLWARKEKGEPCTAQSVQTVWEESPLWLVLLYSTIKEKAEKEEENSYTVQRYSRGKMHYKGCYVQNQIYCIRERECVSDILWMWY